MARFAKTRSISQDAESCGLAFVAAKIKGHFENEKERYNVLSFHLIEAQAISWAVWLKMMNLHSKVSKG